MFINTLCRKLKFPRLRKRSGTIGTASIKNMTGEGSELNIVYVKYDMWKIMSEKIKV
jgi:hypothetical protein